MTWGVATALLEQRGEEGLFEVDEAWLPRVTDAARPHADRPRQPLPRPARSLRGDRGARRRLGRGRSASAPGSTRFVAQRRRPADRRPRSRRRAGSGATASLLRDRGRLAGAAGAPARLRRQALPALRPPVRVRARLRRPPGPLLLPQLRRRAARPDVAATSDRAARHARLARSRSEPRSGELSVELPLPGLYNVYNALAAVAAGAAARDRSRSASPPALARDARPPSAGSRRSRSAARRSRSCSIKNPAGANEVVRTLQLEAGTGRAGPLDRAQRPDRRRARRLLGLGRGLRAAGRRTCAASPAPGRARRRWRCGSSTRAGRRTAIAVEPEIERSLDRAVAETPERLFALPTYTALLELHKLLSGRGLARGSSGDETRGAGRGPAAPATPDPEAAVIWHDVECGATRRT